MPLQTTPKEAPAEQAIEEPRLPVSKSRLRGLCPELYSFNSFIKSLSFRFGITKYSAYDEILKRLYTGEMGPALVISESPFLVAAYSTQMDAVAVLWFWHPGIIRLKKGTRMLTVNSLEEKSESTHRSDLFPGSKATGIYSNFVPTIAEFVSDDYNRIEKLRHAIPKEDWAHVQSLGESYLKRCPGLARLGPPTSARKPAVNISTMRSWESHASKSKR